MIILITTLKTIILTTQLSQIGIWLFQFWLRFRFGLFYNLRFQKSPPLSYHLVSSKEEKIESFGDISSKFSFFSSSDISFPPYNFSFETRDISRYFDVISEIPEKLFPAENFRPALHVVLLSAEMFDSEMFDWLVGCLHVVMPSCTHALPFSFSSTCPLSCAAFPLSPPRIEAKCWILKPRGFEIGFLLLQHEA